MRRDIASELIVAVVAVGVIAFAVIFGIILAISSSSQTVTTIGVTRQPTLRFTLAADAQNTQNAALPTQTVTVMSAEPTHMPSPSDAPIDPRSETAQPPTQTDTPRPTNTITATLTPTPTDTPRPTETVTPSATFTETVTPSLTSTITPSLTDTPRPTSTVTPSDALTDTPRPTGTATPSATFTQTVTPSRTNTLTWTPSPTETITPSTMPTDTPTDTITPSSTLTNTPTPTETLTPSVTFTETRTPSPTPRPPTETPHPTRTPRPTLTPTGFSRVGCTFPGAVITSPLPNEEVTGVIRITGTASTASFAFYRLEVRADDTPLFALAQRSETPVINGTLAELDTDQYGDGLHWLRLTVIQLNGQFPTPCTIPLIFD